MTPEDFEKKLTSLAAMIRRIERFLSSDCHITKEVLEDLLDKTEQRRYQRRITVIACLIFFAAIMQLVLLLWLAE
ncbi:MAG: hypothetical protein GY861_03295 [bacterium]|nr:hypothetical protein [bacterium]